MRASTVANQPRRQNRNCFLLGSCHTCKGDVDASEWAVVHQHSANVGQRRRRRAKDKAGQLWDESAAHRLETLFKELFSLHDLNGNGFLEEMELVKLNEKIAILHYGPDTDTSEVRAKYEAVFRAKLDPNGKPVPYEKFRVYAPEVLDGLDTDPEAQEMILEQFVAEAQSGRELVMESELLTKPTNQTAAVLLTKTKASVIETPREETMDNSAFEAPNWRSIANWPGGITML